MKKVGTELIDPLDDQLVVVFGTVVAEVILTESLTHPEDIIVDVDRHERASPCDEVRHLHDTLTQTWPRLEHPAFGCGIRHHRPRPVRIYAQLASFIDHAAVKPEVTQKPVKRRSVDWFDRPAGDAA
jgi:hypothetical protein